LHKNSTSRHRLDAAGIIIEGLSDTSVQSESSPVMASRMDLGVKPHSQNVA